MSHHSSTDTAPLENKSKYLISQPPLLYARIIPMPQKPRNNPYRNIVTKTRLYFFVANKTMSSKPGKAFIIYSSGRLGIISIAETKTMCRSPVNVTPRTPRRILSIHTAERYSQPPFR
jgi:hypothetical protein